MNKTQKGDIYRLGVEMQHRGLAVWEHSKFNGIKGRHVRNSKHYRDEAIDLNLLNKGQAAEDRRFDRMAPELVRRRFGVIWNRGPGDHTTHLHGETWGNPLQYNGRYRLKRKISWRKLTQDGTWGKNTTRALQEWLGTPVTGGISRRGSTVIKALQAFLNTELRGNLTIDGTIGPATITALQRYLGTPRTGKYSQRGSTMVRAMQTRLNRYGHL